MATVIEVGTVPEGSIQLFYNVTAPVGWTKQTDPSFDDAAVRIVSGSVGSGGATGFTVRHSTSTILVDLTALDSSNFPYHTHPVKRAANGSSTYTRAVESDYDNPGTAGRDIPTSHVGGNQGHTHSGSYDFSVKYCTFIVCRKD